MAKYDFYAVQTISQIGGWVSKRVKESQLHVIRPFLDSRDCQILEIGPGLGELADLLLQAGYRHYTAVEPNHTLRERLSDRGIRCKEYAIPCLQEADGTYDAILLSHVFEHLNGPEQAQLFVSEAWRVLRNRGLLCIVSPDWLQCGQEFFNSDYTHNNITTLRRTNQLLYDHGFRTLKSVYFSGFFRGRLATPLSYVARWALSGSHGERLDGRWYRLKTTFLRSFLVVGQKAPTDV